MFLGRRPSRRSNYARRVFRPVCDGRFKPQPSKPPRLTIVDASAWRGIPNATWASAPPGDTLLSGPVDFSSALEEADAAGAELAQVRSILPGS